MKDIPKCERFRRKKCRRKFRLYFKLSKLYGKFRLYSKLYSI